VAFAVVCNFHLSLIRFSERKLIPAPYSPMYSSYTLASYSSKEGTSIVLKVKAQALLAVGEYSCG
jgi:hypothetical protein